MTPPSRRPRVLLATDRDWLAASIEGVLDHDQFDVSRATTVEKIEGQSDETLPDEVILDQDLVGAETPALCERLVEGVLGQRIPLLVYSSNLRDEDLQTRIVEAGAWTVIQEPIRSAYLVATVRRFLRVGCASRDMEMSVGTTFDSRPDAPDLPDLRGILQRLPVLEALAERNETPVALVAVGPREPGTGELLARQRRRTAELCHQVLRRADLCGWLGEEGDVVIAAYGASREGARTLAQRLAFRAAERSEIDRPEDALSVGIVELRPGEADGGEPVRAEGRANGESELIEAARRALESARASGGGIEFAT